MTTTETLTVTNVDGQHQEPAPDFVAVTVADVAPAQTTKAAHHDAYPALLVQLRPARTSDVPAVGRLIAPYARDNIMLGKELVTLYESIQEMWVLSVGSEVVGCGSLHVLWHDLAEIRTLVVAQAWQGKGLACALVKQLKSVARTVGVSRLFCLTFEVEFFTRQGFTVAVEPVVAPDVYQELRSSPDIGVAEFLDLAWVKPNTLGNTRMICEL